MVFCLETKLTLDKAILKFQNVRQTTEGGLSRGASFAKAVDGHFGQNWKDCAISAFAPTRLLWLSIDLGRLYSVNNVAMLSRGQYGTESEIYVGKTAMSGSIDPAKDHKCGTKFPNGTAPTTLNSFPCSPVRWIQYVTVRRQVPGSSIGEYLQVCEVEVYYNENESTANV